MVVAIKLSHENAVLPKNYQSVVGVRTNDCYVLNFIDIWRSKSNSYQNGSSSQTVQDNRRAALDQIKLIHRYSTVIDGGHSLITQRLLWLLESQVLCVLDCPQQTWEWNDTDSILVDQILLPSFYDN